LEGFELTIEPRCHFPSQHQVGCRLEHLGHEPLAPVALALEVRPATGRNAFELGEFGFQVKDARMGNDGDTSDGEAIRKGGPVPKENPEELVLKFLGLTLSVRGRDAVRWIAAPVAILLLVVAWRILTLCDTHPLAGGLRNECSMCCNVCMTWVRAISRMCVLSSSCGSPSPDRSC
jgi:hypothetical protein